MNYKVSGLLSIVLVFIALGIIGYQLFLLSLIFGIIYSICIPIAFLFTMYHYCRKCHHASSKTCRHVILGLITNKLFKPLGPSKYTMKDIFFSLFPLALLVILPQYWLFQSISLFIAFWILMLVAVVIVRTAVCKRCENINCTFCPNADKCDVK